MHRGGAAHNSVALGGPSVHHAVRRVHRAPCAVGRPPCEPLGRLRAGAVLSVAGYEQRRLVCTTLVFVWPLLALARCCWGISGETGRGHGGVAAALPHPVRRQHGAAGGSAGASAAGISGLVPVGASAAPLAAWAQLGLCAANIVYALTCPGTALRYGNEVTSGFGLWHAFLWQNFELGICCYVPDGAGAASSVLCILRASGVRRLGAVPPAALPAVQPVPGKCRAGAGCAGRAAACAGAASIVLPMR